ncbi:hypothetical protein KPL70_021543 [Citrus sinensis]|nr:hypothetical protein KPL70_021543 [Citrus sinensis]
MREWYKSQPSDELILCLLKKKRLDPHFSYGPIKEIGHICSLEPWDLATESETDSEDQACYFFYEPRYTKSNDAHRATNAGSWKVTRKVSQIEARNGLTGTKKSLTFYLRGLPRKEAITEWGMHEYHVKDDPSYEKEFVLCRIFRRRNKKKKRGISTTDEGESSKQLVSSPQQSPSDHSISNGNHSEESTHTIPQQQLQYHNSISYPRNLNLQNTFAYPQSITDDSPTQLSPGNHLISNRNHNDENIPTNQPLLQIQNHNLISCVGNHSEGTTHTYPQQLPNHNSISYTGNRIEQNMYLLKYPWVMPNYSPTQQLPCDHFISARNYSEEYVPINQQPQPNDNLISHLGNQIEGFSPTNSLLPQNSNLEWQLPLHHPLEMHNSAENTFQEGCQPIGEITSYGGYNRLNDASFSAVQAPISQEQGLKYSNSSFDNCDFSDCQIFSDASPKAFQDESSCGEPGQTLTPHFNPSQSDGEVLAYAVNSSDTNTADNYAWVKEPLLEKDKGLLIGELKSYGGNNRLNEASFSFSDNCDFSDSEIYSDEQLLNCLRAFLDEISREETGKTISPDFNVSKSDGEASAYAKDSSDTNTAYNDAWLKERLENFA